MVEIEYINQYWLYADDVNCNCFRLKRRKNNIIKNHTDGYGQLHNQKERRNERKAIKCKNPSKYQTQNKIIKNEIKLNINYVEPEDIPLIVYVSPKKDEVIQPNIIKIIETEKSDIAELIEEEMNRGMLTNVTIPNLLNSAYKDNPYISSDKFTT